METMKTLRYKRNALKDLKRKRVEDLRAALPVLNRSQVRRARLPYWQAIYLDLEDDGFEATLGYLKQLVEYQENLRRQHGKDSAISVQPLLLENKNQLDKIYKGLKVAEIAHRAGKYNVEWEEILKLGVFYYNFPTDDWLWLAEQLLIRCVDFSRKCRKDADKYEALSRYLLGLFYLNKRQNMNDAKEHFLIVKRLSKGKSWNAHKVLNEKQDRVYAEVCKLMSRIFIEEGKTIMYDDACAAERLFIKSEKYATIACLKIEKAEAMKLKGICCLMKGEFHTAAITFYRVLLIQMEAMNPEKIFEARLNLAMAYLNTERKADGLLQLQYSAFEKDPDFAIHVAQAHKYLGQYYLKHGSPVQATPLLIKAIRIASEVKDQDCVQQARNLAAVSAAQELMSRYVKLVMRSANAQDVPNVPILHKLLNWKDSRELFWKEVPIEEDAGVWNFENELLGKVAENVFINDGDQESIFGWQLGVDDEHQVYEDEEMEENATKQSSLTTEYSTSFDMEKFETEMNAVSLNDNPSENDDGT